jgi:hypothetical protein
MPFVSVKLSDGLGNRLFQVAAMLGYAEKHGHTPVFLRSRIVPNSHSGPHTILDYFPDIPVLTKEKEEKEKEWMILSQDADSVFTFVELPFVATNVVLEGYFQSEKYFPLFRIRPAILERSVLKPREDCIFMHVRRGDYLSPYTAHHRVELSAYYRRALSLIDPSFSILVCSDDMDWCRKELPRMYDVPRSRWIFLEYSDTDTLAAMRACAGGICANSTFSWWGAYFGARCEVYMPDTWGFPPLPPARDIYPPWATVLPVLPVLPLKN